MQTYICMPPREECRSSRISPVVFRVWEDRDENLNALVRANIENHTLAQASAYYFVMARRDVTAISEDMSYDLYMVVLLLLDNNKNK